MPFHCGQRASGSVARPRPQPHIVSRTGHLANLSLDLKRENDCGSRLWLFAIHSPTPIHYPAVRRHVPVRQIEVHAARQNPMSEASLTATNISRPNWIGGAAAPRNSTRPTTVPGQLRGAQPLASQSPERERPTSSHAPAEYIALSQKSYTALPLPISSPRMNGLPSELPTRQHHPRRSRNPMPTSLPLTSSLRSVEQTPSRPTTTPRREQGHRPSIVTQGGKQNSARFRLQQELAQKGDDAQKLVAREQMILHMRTADNRASKSMALAQVEHPLHPDRWLGQEMNTGWRHLPHTPSKPLGPRDPAEERASRQVAWP